LNGQQQQVTADFDFICDLPSFHDFSFQNTIAAVDPHVIDGNSNNNTRTASITDTGEGEVDAEILSMDLTGSAQPLAGVPFTITVDEDVAFTDVDALPDAFFNVFFEVDVPSLPPDCTVDPLDDVVRSELDEGLTTTVSADFEVTCTQVSSHEISFTNTITSVDQHVYDVDSLNDTRTETFQFSVLHQCNGLLSTIVGTPASETINGTSGIDVIVALAGNDTIKGRAGNDVICAGPGDDRVYGGDGADLIFGEGGNDVVYGNAGEDEILGGDGNDRLKGDEDNDIGVMTK
jgi:Ca2+-binding RTX toxin-like protein